MRRDYPEQLSDAHPNSIPLGFLPLDVQERCLSLYFFHDRYLDVDLFHLAAKDDITSLYNTKERHPNPIVHSLLQGERLRRFFRETALLRQIRCIMLAYSGSGQVTAKLELLAKNNHMSYRTLIRKRNYYMNKTSIRMLLDADHNACLYRDDRRSMCLFASDYAIYRHLMVSAPSANKILREFKSMKPYPCAQCPYSAQYHSQYAAEDNTFIPSFVCTRNREYMLTPKSRYPLNDLFSKITAQEVCLARKGVKAWQDKYHYTPTRKKPEEVNAVWFADHTLLDIHVITERHKDGTFKTSRVWLTAVTDAATNCMVGYALSTQPNASTIAEAFARAAVFTIDSPFYGLPRIFYIDNGKDFRSKLLTSESCSSKKLLLNKDFAESGMLEWLGIRVIHALPYRGCSKTIERIFGTIEREWISELPGWCANKPENRPVTFANDLKTGRLYTYEQFASYFADTIWPGYNRFKSESGNASPLELYHSLPRADTLVPSWRTMAVLKYKSVTRIVQRKGLEYERRWYWHPKLAPYIGEEVRVFAFDSPFNRTVAVTANRLFIAEAHLIENLHLVEDQRYRVIQHLTEQAAHRKKVSERLETIRKVILQTDIMERGINIPAIEQYVFTEALDDARNQTGTMDDNRIPEELKVLAAEYAVLPLSEDAPDEQPLQDFMHQIGKSLL